MSSGQCGICGRYVEYRVRYTENGRQWVFELCGEHDTQASVEGLTQRNMSDDVPEVLQGKRAADINVDVPIVGCKYRDKVEERIKQVHAEIEKDARMMRWHAAFNL